MKIIFLSFYNGLVNRGVETFVKELANRLAKKCEVIVFQAGPPNGKENYRVIQSSAENVFIFTLQIILRITKEKPDFIYPLNGRWQAFLCRLLTLFLKTKLIIGGHAGIGRDDLFNLWLWPNIFVSLSVKGDKWARKMAPWVKTTIIPHGVDCDRFNPDIKSFKIELDRPIFLTVAGKEKFKRVELTIRAVSHLAQGSLVILGKQPEGIIKLGQKLLGRKRFKVMECTNDKMPQVYNAADVFTLVSDNREAFAISYLEAMACNLPIVATDDELRREIIGAAGLYVNPININQYAFVLKEASVRDWSNLPRRQAENYSWDEVVEVYEDLLKKLA